MVLQLRSRLVSNRVEDEETEPTTLEKLHSKVEEVEYVQIELGNVCEQVQGGVEQLNQNLTSQVLAVMQIKQDLAFQLSEVMQIKQDLALQLSEVVQIKSQMSDVARRVLEMELTKEHLTSEVLQVLRIKEELKQGLASEVLQVSNSVASFKQGLSSQVIELKQGLTSQVAELKQVVQIEKGLTSQVVQIKQRFTSQVAEVAQVKQALANTVRSTSIVAENCNEIKKDLASLGPQVFTMQTSLGGLGRSITQDTLIVKKHCYRLQYLEKVTEKLFPQFSEYHRTQYIDNLARKEG
tara:strand:- start:753 stop:1637 length:885 start_codon:yes stop_codon:yes gene_type:complete